jgi:hypothetical protein
MQIKLESINPVISFESYLREYDEILTGKRKAFSASLMSKNQGTLMCVKMLRHIFKYYMHWTPTDVRDKLTPEVIKAMKIEPLIKRLPCPPELDPEKELYYIAWHLYPETQTVSSIDLIVKLYSDLLNGRIKKFPAGYFDGTDGACRAQILLRVMIQEFLPPFSSLESMYAFFASGEGRKAINDYRLTVPLQELYGTPLAYFHDCLSDNQKDEELYHKYNAKSRDTLFLPVTEEEKRIYFGEEQESLLGDSSDMIYEEDEFEEVEEVEDVELFSAEPEATETMEIVAEEIEETEELEEESVIEFSTEPVEDVEETESIE